MQKEPPGTINFALVKINADMLPSDKWVIDQAIKCIENDDPDFMYVILMNMDLAGHIHGAFLADNGPDGSDGTSGTPGFELILVFSALAFILFLRRKRQ